MAKAKPAPSAPPPAPAAREGYTVVARRYRPQQFADLVGQEHVAQALANALSSGRIAHAYLFTGARGVGKTSAARILAKALNCEAGPTATPCGTCALCKGISEGVIADVIEIDAASNTGVENIRELRAAVGFLPLWGRYRVYIIDEVHMLSTGAFNALLKTLEEPPPHVKFVFATTEVQKIPVTILSRCQRFDFAHIGPAKVFETLKGIVQKEGLDADDDALRLLARRASGSMRDAQTLLDQLLGSATGKLTAEAVHQLLGTAADDRVIELADAILTGDAVRGLAGVAEAADRGLQLGELLDQLVDYWRGLMLVSVAGPSASDLPGVPALQERIRAHAANRSLDAILTGLDILTTAKSRMRGSPHAQVVLEVAVVRLARLDELLSVGALAKWVMGAGELPADAPQTRPTAKTSTAPTRAMPSTQPVDPSKKNGTPTARPPSEGTPSNSADAESLPIWERLLQAAGAMRGAQLRQAQSHAIIGPNSLAIRFEARYSSACDACGSEAGLEAIRSSLKKLTGQDWAVRVERVADTVDTTTRNVADRKKGVLELPLFRKASDVLGAQLLRVDDGFDPTSRPTATAVAPDTDPDEV